MISVIQNDTVYEIRFKYDPEIIQIIKTVNGRQWNPERKFWTIPVDRLGFLLNAFKGTKFEQTIQIQSSENLGKNEELPITQSIPNISLKGIKLYVEDGEKLFEHQKDSIRYAINRYRLGMNSGFLLADSPGLGKSLSACNIALYRKSHYKFKHCLIVCCINTSKYNWYDDILKHTNGEFEPYILGSRKNRKGRIVYKDSKEKLEDLESLKKLGKKDESLPYFLIMNIEAIRYKEGRKYPIAERIAELCNSGKINMIVIDEIHKNCSPTSQQGKQLMKIKKATESKVEWLPMTGTPITTSPLNCFLPFRLIDAHDRDSFYLWSQHYCVYGGFGGHEIIGYKNMPELKLMVQQNMLRRLKKDALDLPDKIHITEYVDNTPYQNSLYRQVRGEIAAQRGVITASMNPLAQFMKLRQVNGYPEVIDSNLKVDGTYLSKNARMRRCLEIIEDHIANDEKVIVFSNWVEPLRTLYKFASKKWKTCVYTGTMKTEEREKHKYAFQNDPQYKLMLGTIGALGTSHTLTASHVVIFYDDCWNPTDKEQAEDRANRIGSTESETIYTLISRGTIDERVQQILYTKDGISKFIVDDDLDLKKNPELFDLLLGQDL